MKKLYSCLNRSSRYVIIFISLLAIFINGCKKEEKKEIVINFWAMGTEGEQVVNLISEFEHDNPGIKIKAQQIPWTAAHEKLITAFASGTLPDVFQMGNTWIPEFSELNCLENLNARVSSSSIIKSTNYFEGIWQTNVIDTNILAIPWYVDTRVLFYRKDLLESVGYKAAPKTWDELYGISKKLRVLYGNQKKYALFLPVNEYAPFVIFGLQAGSKLLKDGGRYADFSGAEFSKAFDFVAKFYSEELSPRGMQEVNNIYQAFAEGYFAMFISGPWNITELNKRLPENLKSQWFIAPLPSPDNQYPGYSSAGGASLVIAKTSDKKEACWKWIEYLSSKKTQLKFYQIVSALPAVKEVWNDSTLKNNLYMPVFYSQLERTISTPKVSEWEQIAFSKIQQYVESVAAGTMGSKEALKKLDEDANKILEKRRWIISRKSGVITK